MKVGRAAWHCGGQDSGHIHMKSGGCHDPFGSRMAGWVWVVFGEYKDPKLGVPRHDGGPSP